MWNFIVVPISTVKNKINLKYIFSTSRKIAGINKNSVAVIKSTVLPGKGQKLWKRHD